MGKGWPTFMIKFKEKKINKEEIFLFTKNICLDVIKSMKENNIDAYCSYFKHTSISKLNIDLARISYVKDFEIDDLYYFDQTSEFKIIITLFIYKHDEDDERELLTIYNLELDQSLNVIDDSFKIAM